MPMIPSQPARAGRTCATCACYYELPHPQNPLQKQGFCARLPPIAGTVRMQVPRLDKEGKAVLARLDSKPVMDSIEDIAWTHAPMAASLGCFDGWRPLGALPGEKRSDYRWRQALEALRPAIESLLAEIPEEALAPYGLTRELVRALLIAVVDSPQAANEPPADPVEDLPPKMPPTGLNS